MDRALVVAIAVAMGTPKATAEQNYDEAYPPPSLPGENYVIGGGRERRSDGRVWEIVIYGDGRREETLIEG